MDSRDQFEAWANQNSIGLNLERRPDYCELYPGMYTYMETHIAWLAWQKSRELVLGK